MQLGSGGLRSVEGSARDQADNFQDPSPHVFTVGFTLPSCAPENSTCGGALALTGAYY
jgi:hypothetical protein